MVAVTVRLPSHIPVVERDYLRLGASAPRSLRVTSRYLELDGRPWLPIMGEFHYSRYPDDEWELELRKMRFDGHSRLHVAWDFVIMSQMPFSVERFRQKEIKA